MNKLPSPMDKPERSRYGSGKNQTFIWSQANFDVDGDNKENKDVQELFAGSYADFERGPQGKGLFDKNRNQNRKKIIFQRL